MKESEVPKAALEALKRHANNAAFREFAKEFEHGHTFYEGSYKGPSGNVDVLVTETGDLVEIEEIIPGEKVPTAVRAKAGRAAGQDATLTFEKKTIVMYEVHFKKEGKGHEIVFTPDGRLFRERGSRKGENDEDEDEDD